MYNSIQYQFKDQSQVASGFFGLPDFRGRFALGADNMGGSSANRVSDVNADTVGLASGVEARSIDVKNLPEHEHYNSNTGLEEFETFDITELGTPYNVMNPFLTVKYIIYTGVGG